MGFVKNSLTWFSIQEEFFERNVAHLQRQQHIALWATRARRPPLPVRYWQGIQSSWC